MTAIDSGRRIEVSEEYTVRLKPTEDVEVPSRFSIWSFPRTLYEKFLTLFNTCVLVWSGDLRESISSYCLPNQWLGEFNTLFMRCYVTSHPTVMGEILKHPRHDPKSGFFKNPKGTVELQRIYVDIFKTVDLENCLRFCQAHSVDKLRKPLLQTLSYSNMEKKGKIFEMIMNEIKFMFRKDKEVHIKKLCRFFAVYAISKLLLRLPQKIDSHKVLVKAIKNIEHVSYQRALNQNIDENKYQQSLSVIKQVIDLAMEIQDEGALGYALSQSDLTEEQIQCTLFMILMSYGETASLLNYCVWQLGQNPSYQKQILDDIHEGSSNQSLWMRNSSYMKVFVKESMRLFTPIYAIPREISKKCELTVEDQKGRIVYSQAFKEGDLLMCCPTFAGRDLLQFENPDRFNPSHFDKDVENPDAEHAMPWLPLGSGMHFCPGNIFALELVKAFLLWVTENYEITSSPQNLHIKGLTILDIEDELTGTFVIRSTN